MAEFSPETSSGGPAVEKEVLAARKKALLLLERMDRSRYELAGKLARAGFSEEAVEDALDYVTGFGYLDDLRFAKNYLRREQEKNGKRKLVYALKKAGISEEILEQALSEAAEEEPADEVEKVKALIRKRYSSEEKPDQAELRRLTGYVSRRGFSFEDIYQALEELGLKD